MAEPENETSPQGTNAMPVNRMPDGELLARTKQWFQENTDGASIAAAGEVIAVACRLEERVEQLEHLREIAIDIEACLDSRVWPMQFIREAFRGAISRTAISELKKEQEGDG